MGSYIPPASLPGKAGFGSHVFISSPTSSAAIFAKSFAATYGPQIAIVAAQYWYARAQRKKLERERDLQGISIRRSPTVDYANIVFGERLLEVGTRAWSNAISPPLGSKVQPTYSEVIAWMNSGRSGIGGMTGMYLNDRKFDFDANDTTQPNDFREVTIGGIGPTDSDEPRNRTIKRWIFKDEATADKAWTSDENRTTAGAVSNQTGGYWEPTATLQQTQLHPFMFQVYEGDQQAADAVNLALWTNGYNNRQIGKGVFYTTIDLNKSAIQQSSAIPDIRILVKGYNCYDPRDTEQKEDDPATWKWTDNPVLHAAYVHSEFIMGGDTSKVDWERVKTFASYCDDMVPFRATSDSSTRPDALPRDVGASFVDQPTETGNILTADLTYEFNAPSDEGSIDADWLPSGVSGRFVSAKIDFRDGERNTQPRIEFVFTTNQIVEDTLDDMRFSFKWGPNDIDFYVDTWTVAADGSNWKYTPSSSRRWGTSSTSLHENLDSTSSVTVSVYVPQDAGREKRYRADVAVLGSASPADILEQLKLAVDGDYVKYHDTGKWALEPASPDASSVVVDEKKLADYPSHVSSDDVSERFTEIVGAYVDAANNWQRAETPPARSQALIDREGGRLPREEISFDACVRFPQVWRLLQRQLKRQEMQETITLPMFWDGLEIAFGVRFDFASRLLSIDAAKKFRTERLSLGNDGYPITIGAREDADYIYDGVDLQDYPGYTYEGELEVPDLAPPAVGSLTATGIVEAIKLDWTAPAFGEIGNVEIYDSDTASWNHESRRLAAVSGLGATSLTIPYDPGTRKYFWAINVVGRERSARFPNDDVTAVTAVVPHRVVELVGDCPPEEDWAPGRIISDTLTGRQWYGGPDPWTTAAAYDATMPRADRPNRFNYNANGGNNHLRLEQPFPTGPDVRWQPFVPPGASANIPGGEYTGLERPELLSDVLIAVQGTATVQENRAGVLFIRDATVNRILAGGNQQFLGFVPSTSEVPDEIFTDASNAHMNSIDVRVDAGSESIALIFRDDNVGNYPEGPHLAKPGAKYTVVLRVDATYYALPFVATDDREPYALTVPSGFYAAMRTLYGGTNTPACGIALIDEDDWTGGTNWQSAFTLVSRTETRTFCTPYTGTDDASPYDWLRDGDAPNFSGTGHKILELKQSVRCWMPDFLSKWLKVLPPQVPDIPRPATGPIYKRTVPADKVGDLNAGPQENQVVSTPASFAVTEDGIAWIKTNSIAIPRNRATAPNERSVQALAYIWRLWFSVDDDAIGSTRRYFAKIDPPNTVTLWWEEFPHSWINASLQPREATEGREQNKALILPAASRNWCGIDVVEPTDIRGNIIRSPKFDVDSLLQGTSESGILNIAFSLAKDGEDGDAKVDDNDFTILQPAP